jgi:hypothetical protein
MNARYSGRCKGCGGGIAAGERILWSKETGALHNGACLDVYHGNQFGRHEAAQERRAYETEMDWEAAQLRRDEAEYQTGRAQVAEIQALTTAGSALREALYREMEQRDYDLYG